jgi:hypothetical protein
MQIADCRLQNEGRACGSLHLAFGALDFDSQDFELPCLTLGSGAPNRQSAIHILQFAS